MFYDNYLRLCNRRGVSASAAAQEMGLSRAAVTGWAQGNTPRDSTLRRIADYFDVTVDELKADKEKPADEGGLVNSDIDLTEDLERLAKRPELRRLFSVTKDATKADVEKAVRIIEALRNEEQKK